MRDTNQPIKKKGSKTIATPHVQTCIHQRLHAIYVTNDMRTNLVNLLLKTPNMSEETGSNLLRTAPDVSEEIRSVGKRKMKKDEP